MSNFILTQLVVFVTLWCAAFSHEPATLVGDSSVVIPDGTGVWGFNGSSIGAFHVTQKPYNPTEHKMSFWFRTTRPSVLLAEIYGEPCLSYIALEHGRLVFTCALRNYSLIMSSGSQLHDGKWHKALFYINSSYALLESESDKSVHGVRESFPVPGSDIFGEQRYIKLGPVRNVWSEETVVGCMRDVKYNDALYLQESEDVKLGEVELECRINDCDSNPCQNGGICSKIGEKHECLCQRPYDGETCEYISVAAVFNHNESSTSLAIVDIPAARIGDDFEISMIVQTKKSQGTIFLLTDLNGSFVQMECSEEGRLVAVYRNSNVAITYRYSGVQLINEDEKHLISLERRVSYRERDNTITIHIDNITSTIYFDNSQEFRPTVMYIGGIPANLSDDYLLFPGYANQNSRNTGRNKNMDTFVPEELRFIGSIQDVRVGLKGPVERNSPWESEYRVDFFDSDRKPGMKPALGTVRSQNLLRGVIGS